MIQKTISIDEQAMYDALYDKLEPSYDLSCCSYDDAVSAVLVAKCLRQRALDPLFERDIYGESRHYYARQELEDVLEQAVSDGVYTDDQAELFRSTGEYRDLLVELESRDESQAEKDAFLQTRLRCRVTIHSNYDCWEPLWSSKALLGGEGALTDLMKMLCLNPYKVKGEAARRDVPCEGPFPNIPFRNGRETVSYKDFVECLIECPNYANWTFFGRFDMSALWDTGCDPGGLVIPEGTVCTMYNDWNGGGSLSFAKTIRKVSLSELNRRADSRYGQAEPYVDERYDPGEDLHGGYPSSEVYAGELSAKEILTNQAL